MVKPLKDILAEIEERQPIQRFYNGGMGGPDEEQGSMAGDMTPSDPGQDDTLGEEDEGVATFEDYQGLMDAGAYQPEGQLVPGSFDKDGNFIASKYDVNIPDVLTDIEIANQMHQSAVNEANLEQLGYIFQDPDYMKAVDKGGTPQIGRAHV